MTKETLKQSIMTQVEEGKLKQHARSFFVVREYGLWLLAIAAIAIGAFAMALIFAAVDDLRSTMFALKSNGLQGMLLLLPYIWIITLIGFLSLGLYRLRQTEHGHRYPLWGLLGVVFAASVVGGGVLYATGVAHSTDHFLAERSSHYQRFGNPQHAAWRNPDGGILAGKVLSISTSSIALRDIHGADWTVIGDGVTSSVAIGAIVRMIGEPDIEAMVFDVETIAAARQPVFGKKQRAGVPNKPPMPREKRENERK